MKRIYHGILSSVSNEHSQSIGFKHFNNAVLILNELYTWRAVQSLNNLFVLFNDVHLFYLVDALILLS